jgi:hypothetical protein
VYCGAAELAVDYFRNLGFSIPPNENPADFFLDAITGRIACPTRPNFSPRLAFSPQANRHRRRCGRLDLRICVAVLLRLLRPARAAGNVLAHVPVA